MSKVNELSQLILADLLTDFKDRSCTADDLHNGYTGVNFAALKQKYGAASPVDFDLAFKDLEESDLIETGPMVAYDNHPNSGFFVVGLRSKYEFAYLSEKGYKAAQKTQTKKRSASNTSVHISGGTFHQSPIGIGSHVTQSLTGTFGNAPVFGGLRNAVDESDLPNEQRTELVAGIAAMENAPDARTLFDGYRDFITLAASHMTLVAPFLPALAALLSNSN